MNLPSTFKETSPLQACLERLERSEIFARSGVLLQLLRFLADNMQDADVLKETYIGTVFYSRTANYDPRLDSIVRVI